MVILTIWVKITMRLLKWIMILSWMDGNYGIYGGGCIIQGDELYYTGGTMITDRTSEELPNLQTFKLSFSSKNSSQLTGPWMALDYDIEPDQTSLGSSVVKLSDDRIGIIGGTSHTNSSLRVLDIPTGDVMDQKIQSQTPVVYRGGIWVPYTLSGTSQFNQHTILHYGGSVRVNGIEKFNTAVRTLDIKSLKWNSLPGLGPKLKNIVTAFNGGKLFIIGGVDDKDEVKSMTNISRYDVKSGKWDYVTTSGNNPSTRVNTNYVQDDDVIYLVGGSNLDTTSINDNSIYSLNLNSLIWSANGTPRKFKPAASGCLAYYRGTLVSSFGTHDDSPGTTYTFNTSDWSMIDHHGLTGENDQFPPRPPSSSRRPTLSSGAIIGIAAGILAILLFLSLLLIIFVYLRHRRNSRSHQNSDPQHPHLAPPELLVGHVWSPNPPEASQLYSLDETHVPDFDTDLLRPEITPMSSLSKPAHVKRARTHHV